MSVLKKTASGEARLHIRETKEGGKENFLKAIEQNAYLNMKARTLQARPNTVILRNLDETTTTEEIVEALHSLNITEATVEPPRQSANGKWSKSLSPAEASRLACSPVAT